jgi:hypothetical protein
VNESAGPRETWKTWLEELRSLLQNIAVVLMSLHLYGNQQGWLCALGYPESLEATLLTA